MKRHTLLVALLVAFRLVWFPFAAEAEEAKLSRLGFLASHLASFPPYQAFQQTLRELGYVEGKNITIEARLRTTNLTVCLSWRASLSAAMWICCLSPATKA